MKAEGSGGGRSKIVNTSSSSIYKSEEVTVFFFLKFLIQAVDACKSTSNGNNEEI
jgi:hypothetical protein